MQKVPFTTVKHNQGSAMLGMLISVVFMVFILVNFLIPIQQKFAAYSTVEDAANNGVIDISGDQFLIAQSVIDEHLGLAYVSTSSQCRELTLNTPELDILANRYLAEPVKKKYLEVKQKQASRCAS